MTTAHAGEADLTSGWRDCESNGKIDFAIATDKLEPGAGTGPRVNDAELVLMVVEGRARTHVEGEQTVLTKGASVLIPAAATHEVENVGAGTLRLLTAYGDDQAA